MVHGCMVYTERVETAAVSRGTNHVSVVSTPLRWLLKKKKKKKRYKKSISCSEYARERRIALYKSDLYQLLLTDGVERIYKKYGIFRMYRYHLELN